MNQLCLSCGWTGSVKELASVLPHEPGEVCPECSSNLIFDADMSVLAKKTLRRYLEHKDPQQTD